MTTTPTQPALAGPQNKRDTLKREIAEYRSRGLEHTEECADRGHTEGVIAFPSICASLGGAQSVRYSARVARIVTADGREHRVLRSALPPVNKWTAFTLADSIATQEAR